MPIDILKPGTQVILGNQGAYAEVIKFIGNGALSMVYKVHYHCRNSDGSYSDKEALMREFFPSGAKDELYDYFTRVYKNGRYDGFEVDPGQNIQSAFCRFKDNQIYQELINNEVLSKYVVKIQDQSLLYSDEGKNYYKGIFITDDDFCNSCYRIFADKPLIDNLQFLHTLTNIVGDFHENGFLIPDLKPENIIYFKSYTTILKLIDFDSVLKKPVASDCIIPRSKGYCAPEIEKGIVNDRSDIFSLGMILTEILFGFDWYNLIETHDSVHEIIKYGKLLYGFEELLYNNTYIDAKQNGYRLSFGTIIFIKKILSKSICHDSEYRYHSCREMARDILTLIEIISNHGVHPEVMLNNAIKDVQNKEKFSADNFDPDLFTEVEVVE